MRFLHLNSFIFIITAAVLFSGFSYAQAPDDDEKDGSKMVWENHESVTGIYTTKFPQDYLYNVFPFQFNKTDVAFSAEIYADLEENNQARSRIGKSAFIHSFHTFGQEMSAARAQKTLDRYALKYKSMAKSLNGTLIKNEDLKHNGYLAKSMYITYQDNAQNEKSFSNKTAIRVHIYATNYAIIEQVITGSAMDMYSYRFDDFFDSIKFADGLGKSDTPLGTGWVSHISPNKVFTIKTPPVNKYYTPDAPKRKSSKNRDRLTYKITDPVVDDSVYYNVTSYKLKSPPGDTTVQALLTKNHIGKFIDTMSDVNISTRKKQIGDIASYETSIVVSPRRHLPYISKLVYSVDVKDNFVLVKEFLLGVHHYDTGMENTFFDLTTFHPEKYEYTPKN